ncbi:MAG: hypothetical protein LBP67_00190 [Bacteroidales bacterium]|jgi:hypothetical protein|nr:hypothetical protein [Bacteroidales bacterium]
MEKEIKGKVKETSFTTIQIECSNAHSIPLFKDYLKVIQEHFDIKKNAKNTAYAFILSKGLFNDFKDFSKEVRKANLNPDALCLDILETTNQN